MPTTSKYVFVQKNSNGQYTTYGGSVGKSTANANVNQVENFLILTTEPVTTNSHNNNINNNNNNNIITSSGVMATETPTKVSTNNHIHNNTTINSTTITGAGRTSGEHDDNELRPLAWLNDSNLIKGIVHSDNTGNNNNNNGNNNICIINAADAHELIEELPHHLAGEENVATTVISHVIDATHQKSDNKITKIKLKDNQQQLIDVLVNNNNHNISDNNNNANNLVVNDFQKQFIVNASKRVNIQNSNTSTTGAGTSANTNFLQQSPQKQQMQKLSTFTYTTNNNNNINNNNININDGNNKEHQISHVYGNMTTMGTGATTTVHVGPSGTTTVVEYNSNNKNNNKATIVHLNKQKLFGTTASSAPMANTTVTTTATSNNNHIFANTYNTSNINSIINNINNHNNKLTYITSSIATNNNSNNNNNNHNNGVGNFETINTMPQTAAINFVKSDNFAIISNSNNHNNPKTISYIQMSKPTNNNSTTTATTTNSSSSSTTTTTTTTTHHPHKKYLREKMCVFKEYNNNNNNNNNSETTTEDASTTTTTKIINYSHNNNNNNSVNSYTENNNNNCGIKILSTTTAAPTTSTPISSAFYNIIPNNNINIVNTPTNLSTTSLGSDTTPTTYLTLSSTTTGAASNSSNHDNISAYTILNSHQINNPSLLTLPESSVATLTTPSVVLSNNDYYNLTKINSDNNHNNKQPQVLPNNDILHQSEIQSLDLRSPTSYTSYDNDSVKDFETNIYVSQQQQQQPTASNKSAKSRGSNGGSGSNTPQKHKHPNNVPYDPLVHTHNKPPYSFSSLIFMAIEGSIEKALPVKEIYAWIVAHFPYFKTAPTGWKNSVRHNLSLNKSFVKVEKAPVYSNLKHMGKGSLWRVEPLQRQNLIQALTRSPFFPNSTVDKITIKNANTGIGLPDEEDSAPSSSHVAYEDEIIITKPTQSSSSVCGNSNATNINARFDPRLFPNLSKAFNEMTEHTVLNDVPDDEMPSDYSTNHNTNNNNTQQHLAQNKTDSYQLTLINNNNNNQHKKSTQINGFINDENILTTTSSAPETTKPVAPILLLNHFSSLEHLTRDCGADSMDDVNAATAMLALKHGPKIFSETFHNSSPVITSSPSEDHTYSAGGSSNAGSGASTPLMLTNNNNNSNTPLVIGINGNREQAQLQLLNGCDSQSNCASSEDAAYESSDELHNQVSMEELEDQQRHRDGVDALLSLSLSSSVLDSSPNTSSVSSAYSPIKRAYASSGVEDDHYNMMMNNIEPNNHNLSPKHSKTMFSGGNQQQQQQQHMYYDQGNVVKSAKHTYNGNEQQHQQHSQPKQFRQMQTPIQTQQLNAHGLSYLSPSPPKKSKQLRSLRTKIKRKSWLR